VSYEDLTPLAVAARSLVVSDHRYMNRRGFFAALAGALSTAAVDPERLIWTPGKLISIPAPRALVAGPNLLLTPEFIAREWLRALKGNLVFADRVAPRIGDTIRIVRPDGHEERVRLG
jgi:hypothetical protein